MIINVLLIILANVALFLSYYYIREKKLNNSISRYLFLMGMFVFGICFSYGVFGITKDFDIAIIMRTMGIMCIDGFLFMELSFMANISKVNRTIVRVIKSVFMLLIGLDIVIFGNTSVYTLDRNKERTFYYANEVWQRSYHLVYIAAVIIALFILWIICKREAQYKREKTAVNLLFCSNVFLLVCSLPDMILPAYGYPSWPSSAVGGFITYAFIRFVLYKFKPYEITDNAIYDYVYNYADIGFMSFRLNHQLAYANDYAAKLIGINSEGLTLKDFFEMDSIEEASLFEDVIKNKRYELDIKTRNEISTHLTITANYDESGLPYCFVASVIDLTKENMMLEELYRADKEKTQFLSNMSHEIRTPVNTLLGMNEMILKKTKEPRIAGYAGNIKNACNLLISIINDILDFSKIESGEITLSENEYSLSSLVTDLVSMIKERTYKKGLSMNIDIDEYLPARLYGDEMRIRQIITNLLTNAVKYTDHGQIKLKMSGKQIDKKTIYIRIDVIDTGKGIREEDKEKLFSKFSRIDEKTNRHIEGTGLGLSITNHFVKMMNGTLDVESEYGKGSDFYVIIPQRVMSKENVGKIFEKQEIDKKNIEVVETIIAHDARVLIVDDNDMNLKVAKLLLEDTKMTIDTAGDGTSALIKMRDEKYDLIFLDHMMPEMDGIQVLEAMRTENIQSGVPVIVLTANALSGAREMYLEKGFDDYISKPIEMNRMNDILSRFLPKEYIKKNKEVRVYD